MSTRRNTLIRRSMRRFTLGSGPLKRRSDRVQAIGRCVVVLSFVVAPPLAVAAATATTTYLQTVAAVEEADRSRSHAVLLEEAHTPVNDGGDYAVDASVRLVPVRAVWSAPGGLSQEGSVLAEPGSPVGTAVPVWVDRAGSLARPPLDRDGITYSATAMGLLPLIGLPLVTWACYAVLCLTLDSRRERRWEQDWAAVEPDWHSRLL